MLECDSKSHHENEKDPPTQRKGMPYLHLGRQRGDSAAISVYNPAEHHKETGQDSGSNEKLPPDFIRLLHPVCADSFRGNDYSRDAPDYSGNYIQMITFHPLSAVLGKVVFLSDFLSFRIGKAVEICLPTGTEIDMPSPEPSDKRSRSGIMLCPHRTCRTSVSFHNILFKRISSSFSKEHKAALLHHFPESGSQPSSREPAQPSHEAPPPFR